MRLVNTTRLLIRPSLDFPKVLLQLRKYFALKNFAPILNSNGPYLLKVHIFYRPNKIMSWPDLVEHGKGCATMSRLCWPRLLFDLFLWVKMIDVDLHLCNYFSSPYNSCIDRATQWALFKSLGLRNQVCNIEIVEFVSMTIVPYLSQRSGSSERLWCHMLFINEILGLMVIG